MSEYTIKNGVLMSVSEGEKVKIDFQGKRKTQGEKAFKEQNAATAPAQKKIS